MQVSSHGGNDLINSRSGLGDQISCGAGNADVVLADFGDDVDASCERVTRS